MTIPKPIFIKLMITRKPFTNKSYTNLMKIQQRFGRRYYVTDRQSAEVYTHKALRFIS